MTRAPALLLVLAVAAPGCRRPAPPEGPNTPSPASSEPVAPAGPVAALVQAQPPDGPLAAWIASQARTAGGQGARLVVYVGASWCEPCRRFHEAFEQGRLAEPFRGIRFLEFDKDQHGDRLDQAGYTSQYIPLFAVPGTDGRHSGRHIEGSINGPGALGNIVPRLKKLLEAP